MHALGSFRSLYDYWVKVRRLLHTARAHMPCLQGVIFTEHTWMGQNHLGKDDIQQMSHLTKERKSSPAFCSSVLATTRVTVYRAALSIPKRLSSSRKNHPIPRDQLLLAPKILVRQTGRGVLKLRNLRLSDNCRVVRTPIDESVA